MKDESSAEFRRFFVPPIMMAVMRLLLAAARASDALRIAGDDKQADNLQDAISRAGQDVHAAWREVY